MNKENVTVIYADGTTHTLQEWQQQYDLPAGTGMIGQYFSLDEYRFQKDLEEFGSLVVNELLIRFLDMLRIATGEPVIINSFNRTEEYQQLLKKRGYRTATYSPHVVKMAADVDTDSRQQTLKMVNVASRIAQAMAIKIRIGYTKYLEAGQTFVHFDVCPEYFAPGKPFHHQEHPRAWELAITW